MIDKSEELRALRVRESSRIVSTPLTKHLRVRIEEFWEHAKDCLAGGGSRSSVSLNVSFHSSHFCSSISLGSGGGMS